MSVKTNPVRLTLLRGTGGPSQKIGGRKKETCRLSDGAHSVVQNRKSHRDVGQGWGGGTTFKKKRKRIAEFRDTNTKGNS